MLYGDKREDYRKRFFDAWRKHKNNELLEPMEKRILQIILQHKEYINIFDDPEKNMDKDFFSELGETNPFFHMSLHLTILDQLAINQPKEIRNLYKQCIERFGDTHEAEHCLMHSLAIALHDLHYNTTPFDEKKYLNRIKKALRDGYWA